MPHNYLHNHKNFADLIRIVGQEKSIDPILVEKDYWIMHCLFGLQQLRLKFQLKGGTSLSKGFGIISRFSEDIDIMIEPPQTMQVKTNSNNDKEADRKSRKEYYDWLAEYITIAGIEEVARDHVFDDVPKYRSGGIRLYYNSCMPSIASIKDGILLEVGFDDVIPNEPITISSWAYDYVKDKAEFIDNRAKDVPCYHCGYTLIEKLQTISTKFRKQQEEGGLPANFMRHYYDVYCLLQDSKIQTFIGSTEYTAHKMRRFRSGDNQLIAANEAFLLNNQDTRKIYEDAYQSKSELYYGKQPKFEDLIRLISEYAPVL